MSAPRYTPPVRRVNRGRGHSYQDANGLKVPAVTAILGSGVPKPALVNWAGTATADYAINNWDELGDMPPAARLEKLKKARYEERDTAANKGTRVHELAEQLVAGKEIDVPDDLAGHCESYVQFLDDWEPTPVLVEAVVMSHQHGFAGTCDAILDIPGHGRALVDIKTSRSGIFGETALQLAAYRFADVYVDDQGEEQPMLPVDEVFGVHVRADGYDLRPITADREVFREFLYVMQVGRFTEDTSKGYVGEALTPARLMRRRRLEVVGGETA